VSDIEEARKSWLRDRPAFQSLATELARELTADLRREGIWAEIQSRAKELDSLIRKLIRKPNHNYDSIGDKAGVRVIVRYRSEIDPVLEIADRRFSLTEVEDTAERLAPNVVGYQSIHGVLRPRTGQVLAVQFPPDRFHAELQVRTLAQNLWSEMAHDAVYKNDETLEPLPNRLKRRIYILAGTIELADEEFNRIEGEIPQVPEFDILKALERYHYKLTARRVDTETSIDIIRLLMPLYKLEARQIISRLTEFYSDREGILQDIYRRAEALPEKSSAFLLQPEAIMIYDLLEMDSLATRRTWNEAYPEKELERMANAFGISFD
jgi:ppGpp synthetase/RelA/SpoT-type nucleotidyltranferase